MYAVTEKEAASGGVCTDDACWQSGVSPQAQPCYESWCFKDASAPNYSKKCFTQPDCIDYNRRSWTYLLLCLFTITFFGDKFKWDLPMRFLYPYMLFRLMEPFEALQRLNGLIGQMGYTVSMAWPTICLVSAEGGGRRRAIRALGGYVACVIIVAGAVSGWDIDGIDNEWWWFIMNNSFAPCYLVSVFKLWESNRTCTDVWLCGFVAGYFFPLALLWWNEWDKPYELLSISDQLLSFPLCYVGAILWCLEGEVGEGKERRYIELEGVRRWAGKARDRWAAWRGGGEERAVGREIMLEEEPAGSEFEMKDGAAAQ